MTITTRCASCDHDDKNECISSHIPVISLLEDKMFTVFQIEPVAGYFVCSKCRGVEFQTVTIA